MRALVAAYLSDPTTRTRVPWEQAIAEVVARQQVMEEQPGCKQQAILSAPQLMFINRVFYAREFDFNYDQTSAAAAQIRATLAAAAVSASKANPASPAPSNSSPSDASSNLSASEQAAEGLLKSLSALGGGATPGGGASLAFGRNGGGVLKQTYDRPLAFGVDQVISYRLDDALCLIGGGTPSQTGCSPSTPADAVEPTSSDMQTRASDWSGFIQLTANPPDMVAPGQPSANLPDGNAGNPPCHPCPPWENPIICESNQLHCSNPGNPKPNPILSVPPFDLRQD